MALSTLSICTGGGGLELGLHLAGVPVAPVAYVEREAFAAAVLAERMEAQAIPAAPVWSDVKTLCGPTFRDFMGEALRGERLGLLVGGYPCQPFSSAGQRRAADDPRHLWPRIAEAIGEYAPRLCFFENVRGHVTAGLDAVVNDLRSMGYRVSGCLFSAEETGASHLRERLFLLAHAEDDHRRRGERGAEEGTRSGERGRGRPASGGAQLADASREGPQGLVASGSSQPNHGVIGRSCGAEVADTPDNAQVGGCVRDNQIDQPLYPPGPGETERWTGILDVAPSLEPAIRGMADGLAPRVERLRLLGNGVVPLAAAIAYCTLYMALGLEGGTP